jgi:hypothetical protein
MLVVLSFLVTSLSSNQLLVCAVSYRTARSSSFYLKFFNETFVCSCLACMSTISSLAINHSPARQVSAYNDSQLIVCVNPLNPLRQDTLATLTHSNIFDDETKSSDEHLNDLFHRLYCQRSKLIEFYDRAIDLRQSTTKLLFFLNQIDQLLNDYDHASSTNFNSSKSFNNEIYHCANKKTVECLFI